MLAATVGAAIWRAHSDKRALAPQPPEGAPSWSRFTRRGHLVPSSEVGHRPSAGKSRSPSPCQLRDSALSSRTRQTQKLSDTGAHAPSATRKPSKQSALAPPETPQKPNMLPPVLFARDSRTSSASASSETSRDTSIGGSSICSRVSGDSTDSWSSRPTVRQQRRHSHGVDSLHRMSTGEVDAQVEEFFESGEAIDAHTKPPSRRHRSFAARRNFATTLEPLALGSAGREHIVTWDGCETANRVQSKIEDVSSAIARMNGHLREMAVLDALQSA